jgi:S-adenosylmethionine-diacylglycerol 3-amino-3-carboxypropyl transferase
VIDISAEQLALCEMRIETLRTFTHLEFLAFWGYPTKGNFISNADRKSMFEALTLSVQSRNYLTKVFESKDWAPLLLQGRWERTFIFFSKIAKVILGSKKIERLFQFQDLEAQKEFVSKHFLNYRWKFLLLMVGNSRVFNALLYRGSFPQNNTGLSYVQFYNQAYTRLLNQGLARNNFFLQLTLLGELRFAEGVPIEANGSVFNEAKIALSGVEIVFLKEDLVAWLSAQNNISFVSFSNVASYFKGPLEGNFLKLIRGALSPGALVVLRHYLHRPENLDKAGFVNDAPLYESLRKNEKIQMYEIEVLRKESV